MANTETPKPLIPTTPGMFDTLTYADLNQLHSDLCNKIVSLCDQHAALITKTAELGHWTPEGETARQEAAATLAAADVDEQTMKAVTAELRRRDEEASAARTLRAADSKALAAILDGDDYDA